MVKSVSLSLLTVYLCLCLGYVSCLPLYNVHFSVSPSLIL